MKNMVDERFECISAIFRFAGRAEYNMGYSDIDPKDLEFVAINPGSERQRKYQRGICETFRKFDGYEAIKFAKESGLAYDYPFLFAMHVEKKNDEFVFIEDITSLRHGGGWADGRAEKFLPLFNKFYKDTGYADFYNSQIPYFEEITEKFVDNHFKHIDFEWFAKYVDLSDLRCFISPSNSDMNYPATVNEKIIYCLVREDCPAIVHEYCHRFGNPLGKKWYEENPEFQKWCDDSVDTNRFPGYGSGYNMAYEYVTNAYNILYNTQTKKDTKGITDDNIINYTCAEYAPLSMIKHIKNGFPYMGEIYKMILDLDKGYQPKVKPIENAPDLSNTKRYSKTVLEDCGNINMDSGRVWFNGANSWFSLKNIDGGKGGGATVYVNYATKADLSKISLKINDNDEYLLNLAGSLSYAEITVNLEAGENNIITLSKPQEFSNLVINYIAVKLSEDI